MYRSLFIYHVDSWWQCIHLQLNDIRHGISHKNHHLFFVVNASWFCWAGCLDVETSEAFINNIFVYRL